MNQPTQPKDPLRGGAGLDHNPDGTMPNGTPKDLDGSEAKGVPDTGRSESETAHRN